MRSALLRQRRIRYSRFKFLPLKISSKRQQYFLLTHYFDTYNHLTLNRRIKSLWRLISLEILKTVALNCIFHYRIFIKGQPSCKVHKTGSLKGLSASSLKQFAEINGMPRHICGESIIFKFYSLKPCYI